MVDGSIAEQRELCSFSTEESKYATSNWLLAACLLREAATRAALYNKAAPISCAHHFLRRLDGNDNSEESEHTLAEAGAFGPSIVRARDTHTPAAIQRLVRSEHSGDHTANSA